ncbi:MAG: transposase [Myxococcota bacterium]
MNGASLETPERKRRRRFTASEKLRIVKAADAALSSGERGAVAALLRREGLYSSHLSAWRQQLSAHGTEGLASRKPGRKPKQTAAERELAKLKKKNAELERQLRVANSLLDLQKKGTSCWG